MNQLTIVEQNGKFVADSREVAEMVERNHADLLRDIRKYAEVLGKSNFALADLFIESFYTDIQGKPRPHYFLTKKGCDLIANKMTGEKGILFTVAYVTKFEEMEKQISYPGLPTSYKEALLQLVSQVEKNEQLEEQRKLDRPKVIFAEALETSNTTILIGELAKLLKQNGIDIGQNRLFDNLRNQGYLGKRGDYRNIPTQKAMELKLFELKTRTINNPDGSVRVTRTTKVTGKGQIYFINKFKAELATA